jgi:hypothetical protein
MMFSATAICGRLAEFVMRFRFSCLQYHIAVSESQIQNVNNSLNACK